jgi:hypothetical protein
MGFRQKETQKTGGTQMVKRQNKRTRKNRSRKAFSTPSAKPRKINASTAFETCSEYLSPFGGLLAVIKFFDVVQFKEIFHRTYIAPSREPKLGHYLMMSGIVMLLFIGFNRIWHFTYTRLDAIMCGFFQTTTLPAASTFWRYVNSLGINQAQSLLKVMGIVRERVWQLCDFDYSKIHISIDTTVETVYGKHQGARKGHNTKHRGKKGYRPILCFIDETREYLVGKLRKGETVNGKEAEAFISSIPSYLPRSVRKVLLRADGEFLSWNAVKTAMVQGFQFIIANKGCEPPFDAKGWYRPRKRKSIQYNSCIYQPHGWDSPCRFVAMRIPKDIKKVSAQPIQCELFEDERYTYRIFCTNLPGKAHWVIAQYDKRADVENLVGEAKREGLEAIPSARFKNNYAFFQIVMLAYNIWRYMKILAQQNHHNQNTEKSKQDGADFKTIATNTIRIARLKLLIIAAKVVENSNRVKVKYSIQDTRTPYMIRFLKYLDKLRMTLKPWENHLSMKNSAMA